jgi:hypothetical protein
MLNKLLIGAALALALAACASTPPSPEAAKSTVAKTQQPPGCAGNSAIPASQTANPQPCAGFGSVYTRDDITRTGTTNLGAALQYLDPTIKARGP